MRAMPCALDLDALDSAMTSRLWRMLQLVGARRRRATSARPMIARAWARVRPLRRAHASFRDRLASAVDVHDALLEQLAEDPRGVQALEPADGIEIVERHLAVDLREHEAGARVEVQPDDLVRRDGRPRPRFHPADLALVHQRQVLLADPVELRRFLVVGLALQHLAEELERAGEVVEREQLA